MQRVDFVVNTVNSHTVGAKVFYNDDIPVPYIPIAMCAEETILVICNYNGGFFHIHYHLIISDQSG